MKPKIRVLHLTHTDITVDSRILKTIDALSEMDVDIFGIGRSSCLDEKDCLADLVFSYHPIWVRSSAYKFIPKKIQKLFIFCEFYFKYISMCVRLKPDIIHAHDVIVLPIAVFYKFFFNVKIIYDAHELNSNKNGNSKLHNKTSLFVEKVCWSRVNNLIVVSYSINQWYQKNIGYKEAIVTFNSPLLEKGKPENKHYLRQKFLIPERTKILIYVGKLIKGRGIEQLINAFSKNKLSNLHIVFLGDGHLQDFVVDASRQIKNLHHHAAVPHYEVVKICRSADFGLCLLENVSLSDYFSLPNKLFEYAFSGLPIIASDFPEIKLFLEDTNSGFIIKNDFNSVQEFLKNLENNIDQLPIINVSRLQNYSWSQQTHKIKQLYDKLLETF